MPLEVATRPGDLQAAWPLPSDLARTADDHIRLVKAMMRLGYLGVYQTLESVRSLPVTEGSFFTYQNSIWQIQAGELPAFPERLSKFIKLANGRVAVKITNISDAGTNAYQASVLPTGGGLQDRSILCLT
jgi:hypothetical protein